MGSSATGMATDKELIKEAGQELWNTVKKLRPGLPKEARSQLVLKALLTIGDLPDQLQASMVLGQIADQEPDGPLCLPWLTRQSGRSAFNSDPYYGRSGSICAFCIDKRCGCAPCRIANSAA